MKYVDLNIEPLDTKMLYDIFNKEVNNLEYSILDKLNNLVAMDSDLLNNYEKIEKLVGKLEKQDFLTLTDLLKLLLLSVPVFLAFKEIAPAEIEEFEAFLSFLASSSLGITSCNLFSEFKQKMLLKSNSSFLVSHFKTCAKHIDVFCEALSEIEQYQNLLALKKEKRTYSDCLREIFNKNREYIEQKIKCDKFSKDFSCDYAICILETCLYLYGYGSANSSNDSFTKKENHR